MNSESLSILEIILFISSMILMVAIFILIWIVIKERNRKKSANGINKKWKQNNNGKESVSPEKRKEFTKQSIFSFMEFDDIKDGMIIQKNGRKFLMIIELQGINFDLMSGVEKNSVEVGFIQFLNSLRHPIQIYVQTRTVNLGTSINTYKERLNIIGDKYRVKNQEYKGKVNTGTYTKEELDKERFELARQKNLYEYGVDIVNNTERMSLNQNILSKHYYIIISHYADDNPDYHYAKDEIANIAFSELYTRAQTIISSLGVCGVLGKVLDSTEISELLYVAYNRDESEMLDLRKALNSGYEDLYSTAPDVYEERIKELNKKIKEDAEIKAREVVNEVIEETEKQKQAKQIEQRMNFLVNEMAKSIIKQNKRILGKDVTESAVELIENENEKTEDKNKENGGKVDEEKKKSTRRGKKSA